MICIAADGAGAGGVGGGAGSNGQASQRAAGVGATGYGYPVIEATTGMTCTLSVQLTSDIAGASPADLTSATAVKFVAAACAASTDHKIDVSCTYTTAGVVTLTLTPTELDGNNGVWYAEFHVYEGTAIKGNYRAYLCIRPGLSGSTNGVNTVTVMDVRMALMDTDPEANQLIDDLEFSDMMIMNAIQRCIDEWNETPPELSIWYTTATFPYREHLIKGAIGYLMQMIAYRYTRNRMQYQASGFTLDKNDKGPAYIQLAQAARGEWKNFIMAKKTEQNMSEGYGTFELPYFG